MCGEADDCCLEFHHVDKESKCFSIGKIPHTATLEDVKKELAKTICVCANCHRKIHSGETASICSWLLNLVIISTTSLVLSIAICTAHPVPPFTVSSFAIVDTAKIASECLTCCQFFLKRAAGLPSSLIAADNPRCGRRRSI